MDVKEYLKKKKEFEAAVAKNGKQIVHDFVKEFMEENPEVKAITWNQYTPYFNDGDACTFSVHDSYFAFSEPSEEDFENYPDDSEVWKSTYDIKKNKKALEAFENSISGELESLMETAFGDHARVTVLKDDKGKITFRVDQYDHD